MQRRATSNNPRCEYAWLFSGSLLADPKCHLLVVKVASRCNLNCSYCYVYNAGDRSHLLQPAIMADETVAALIQRTATHCRRHGIAEFTFVFHGGEPLLAGPGFFRRFVAHVARDFPPETKPRFCLQTNGTLLTKEWCELLSDLNIGIGISLDGPRNLMIFIAWITLVKVRMTRC